MHDDLPGVSFVDMELGQTTYHERGGWTHFNRFEVSNGTTYSFLFDGQEDGSISIRLFPGKPDYGNRDAGPHKTHLHYDRNSGSYSIDWDSQLYSLEDAKQ